MPPTPDGSCANDAARSRAGCRAGCRSHPCHVASTLRRHPVADGTGVRRERTPVCNETQRSGHACAQCHARLPWRPERRGPEKYRGCTSLSATPVRKGRQSPWIVSGVSATRPLIRCWRETGRSSVLCCRMIARKCSRCPALTAHEVISPGVIESGLSAQTRHRLSAAIGSTGAWAPPGLGRRSWPSASPTAAAGLPFPIHASARTPQA